MNKLARGLAADETMREAQILAMKRAKERRAEAYRLKQSGLPYREIAERLGVSWQRAQNLVHTHIKRNKPNGRKRA